MNISSLLRGIVGVLGVGAARVFAADAPQAAVDAWQAGRHGGMAVAIVTGDEIAFFQAGRFAADDGRPIGSDTLFEIGSITKVFTAILLADAVERGVVRQDDTLGTPFPPGGITYRQLATHTSGLPRLPAGFAPSDPGDPYADETLPALVRALAASAASAKPAAPAYSNFGFAVLGQAVAGAEGGTWPSALKKRVLEPLGLRDTFTSWRDADSRRLAPGHDGSRPSAHWTFDAYAPAGSLVSSARDLARFVQAALGLVETPANAALAATLQRILWDEAATKNSGLAWVLERRGDAQLAWHNGQTGGFHSFVGLNPARKTGVVILANESSAVEPLGYHLLTGEKLRPRTTPAPVSAADSLQPFLGNYPLTPAFVIAITAEGQQLFLQGTGQPRTRLTLLGEDRYTVEGVAAEVVFERKPGGSGVTGLVLHQNGLAQRAPRLATGALPAGKAEIALTAAELVAYAGRFQLAPGAEFIMRVDGDRLFAQLTGQPSVRVFAEQKDKFFYKVVNAQLTFERDAAGKVVAVVLHQNGRDQRAPRVE